MSHLEDQAKIDHLLQRASEILESPGRLVLLHWRMERLMRDASVFESRRGLAGEHAVHVFDQSRRGHSTLVGLERWRLDLGDASFPVVKVLDGLGQVLPDPSIDVWVVPAQSHHHLYRHLRKLAREDEAEDAPPPVMRDPNTPSDVCA